MLRIKLLLVALLVTSFGNAQTVEINGVVIAGSDVENIHVINKTSNKFTTTGPLGGFKIQAKALDTIVFSGIQYQLLELIVSYKNIKEQALTVQLIENINELNEVIVGKVLTGQLDSDIINLDAKPLINFYDVGIPGYTGKKKTQSERRLYTARSGGGLIPIIPLINAISGRTKRLKAQVKLEANIVLLNKIKARFLDDFFSDNKLDESLHLDFFYFCFDDEFFETRCKGKSDMEILKFLEEKFEVYKMNPQAIKD